MTIIFPPPGHFYKICVPHEKYCIFYIKCCIIVTLMPDGLRACRYTTINTFIMINMISISMSPIMFQIYIFFLYVCKTIKLVYVS